MTSTQVDYPIKAKHFLLFLINRVKMSKFVSLSVKNGETTNAKKGLGGGEDNPVEIRRSNFLKL